MYAAGIVDAARGWLGTRFHHQGRIKKTNSHKGGVDCLGLLIGVASELELRDEEGALLTTLDELDYSHYPDSLRLRSKLSSVLECISKEMIRAGDILLLKIADSPQHLAIVGENGSGLSIIHAYAPARAVVEHALDGWWMERVDSAYRIRS